MNTISINNLSKTYGKKNLAFKALDDASFTVPVGSSIGIIGKSGSGKSTLMHAISGLDRPEKGEVIFDGRNVLALPGRKLDQFRAREIGFVFQSFFVSAHETCMQNVALPLEITGVPLLKRKEMALEALKKVDLLDKKNVRAGNLSGGQKQRLAIARAIVHHPRILFADEPTGNLDSVTSQTITDLLFDLQKKEGVTLFLVTHDEELAALCDIQIRIKDGKIAELNYKK